MANDVVIHVKAEGNPDRDMNVLGRKAEGAAKRSFLRTGGHAGAAFAAGFIKTVTLGMVGSGFAMASMKLKPQMAHAGGAMGAALAAGLVVKAASMVSALLPLALGAVMVAGPVAFLVKGMLKAEEEAKKAATRVDSLRKRYAAATDKDVKKRIKDELEFAEMQEKTFRDRAQHWLVLKNKANDFMTTISKPFEGPLLKSMELIGHRLDDWGPRVKKALAPLAKELPGFIGGLMGGINNFFEAIGKKMPSITKGFKEWGKELPGIGKALGEMVAAWIEDGPALAEGIQDTAGSMKDLAKAVGQVGQAFKGFNKTNNRFVDAMLSQKKTIQGWRITMLEGILSVVEAWAKINPKMKTVAASLRKTLDRAKADFNQTTAEINKKKIEPKVRANIRDLESKIKTAKKRLKETNDQKTRSDIKANINQLRGQVALAKLALMSVKDRTVNIVTRRITKYVAGGHDPGYASGGIIGGRTHAAEGGPRRGQVLVGEQGPELVDLPMGSHVNSNPDTRRMMAGRGGGNITINVNAPNYVGAPADLLRALVDAKRRGQLDVILR